MSDKEKKTTQEPLIAYTTPGARIKSAFKRWEAFLFLLIVAEFVLFQISHDKSYLWILK